MLFEWIDREIGLEQRNQFYDHFTRVTFPIEFAGPIISRKCSEHYRPLGKISSGIV